MSTGRRIGCTRRTLAGPAARAALAGLAALVAACGERSVTAPAEPPPPVATVNGVAFRAATAVVERSPLTVRATVIARNTGDRPAELRVASHCTVLLRAHDNAGYEGRPAWEDTRRGQPCTTLVRTLTLQPGGTRSFETVAAPRLERGRWFFTAILRGETREIRVAAGHLDVE